MYTLHHSPYWYADNAKLRAYIAEKHPDALFVEEIAIKTVQGYSENPALVFHQENPPAPFTNKFFAYYRYPDNIDKNAGQWVITGLHDWDPIVEGIFKPSKPSKPSKQIQHTGKLAISRYRHDFYDAGFGFIDGGRDYTRTGGYTLPEIVKINLLTQQALIYGEWRSYKRA